MKNGNVNCNNIVCGCKFFHFFTDNLDVTAGETETVNNSLDNYAACAVGYRINADSLVIENLCGNTSRNGLKSTGKEIIAACCVNTVKKGRARIAHFPTGIRRYRSVKGLFTRVEVFRNILLLGRPLILITGPILVQI